jgi:hypothetical protein
VNHRDSILVHRRDGGRLKASDRWRTEVRSSGATAATRFEILGVLGVGS